MKDDGRWMMDNDGWMMMMMLVGVGVDMLMVVGVGVDMLMLVGVGVDMLMVVGVGVDTVPRCPPVMLLLKRPLQPSLIRLGRLGWSPHCPASPQTNFHNFHNTWLQFLHLHQMEPSLKSTSYIKSFKHHILF